MVKSIVDKEKKEDKEENKDKEGTAKLGEWKFRYKKHLRIIEKLRVGDITEEDINLWESQIHQYFRGSGAVLFGVDSGNMAVDIFKLDSKL